MSEGSENIGRASSPYLREMGHDIMKDVHVHGVFGAAAIMAHKLIPEHMDSEDIALWVASLFIAGSLLTWIFRRYLRRRHQAKMRFRFDWINHL